MGRTAAVVCLMLMLELATGQTAVVERTFPQWLTGIIAVVGFLFLVFVAFLVNKAWCDSSQERRVKAVSSEDWTRTNGATCDPGLDMVRSSDNESAYENVAVDVVGDRVTAM